MSRWNRRGFTLLELLIVIGIVLILSSIGLQNYLLASVRARTSRALTEMKTFATAIETYHSDHTVYPRMTHAGYYGDPAFDYYKNTPLSGTLSKSISTPIAYVSQAFKGDPFVAGLKEVPLDEQLYTYQVMQVYVDREPSSAFWPAAREFYGEWRMCSLGPDEIFYQGFKNSGQLPYDPTNGVLSAGNIWYSHRPQTVLPPIPQLLGEH